MSNTFQILQSDKFGLNAKESYIVVRGEISFLRILGVDPLWELMTATASEDDTGTIVCSNRTGLVQAAWRLGIQLSVRPELHYDRNHREYVKIGVIEKSRLKTEEEFKRELVTLIAHFFELYDNYCHTSDDANSEMRDLYNDIAVDEQGGNVYLGDGVWLSENGTLQDKGR